MDVAEKLAIDAIKADEDSHILLDQERCRDCERRPCIPTCPGALYTLVEETGEMHLEHAGCLECGSCLIVCPRQALTWRHPLGGFGVRYRYG